MMDIPAIRARVEHLRYLAQGLGKEVALWQSQESPLLPQEPHSYPGAVYDGIVGADAAAAVLETALVGHFQAGSRYPDQRRKSIPSHRSSIVRQVWPADLLAADAARLVPSAWAVFLTSPGVCHATNPSRIGRGCACSRPYRNGQRRSAVCPLPAGFPPLRALPRSCLPPALCAALPLSNRHGREGRFRWEAAFRVSGGACWRSIRSRRSVEAGKMRVI